MIDSSFEIRWTPDDGGPRAVVFEPREDGWLRVEFEWSNEQWLEIDREPVTEVGRFDAVRSPVCPCCRPALRSEESPRLEGGDDDAA